jgi:hypothetical protein
LFPLVARDSKKDLGLAKVRRDFRAQNRHIPDSRIMNIKEDGIGHHFPNCLCHA